jgi:RNA polymerase primary sigma factor
LRHGVSDNIPKRIREVADFLNRPTENVAGLVTAGTQKIVEKLAISESELAALLLNTNPNPDAWEVFWKLDDLAPGMSQQIDGRRIEHLTTLRQHGAVQHSLEELSLEERTILKLRYGVLQDEELTLRDIGEILGLSRERVRQIESRAEAKCRRSVRRH